MLIVMHHMSKAFTNRLVSWCMTNNGLRRVSSPYNRYVLWLWSEFDHFILASLFSLFFFFCLFFSSLFFGLLFPTLYEFIGGNLVPLTLEGCSSCENVSTQPYQCDLVHMHCSGEHLLILPRLPLVPGKPTPWFSTACLYTCSHNHTGPTCSSSSSQELSILSDVFTRLVDDDQHWARIEPGSCTLQNTVLVQCQTTQSSCSVCLFLWLLSFCGPWLSQTKWGDFH